MRIISLNANGIRSAGRKGVFDWLQQQDADVVCIQETKAQEHQLKDDELYYPAGYHCAYEDATTKKGYSGVAIYTREQPDEWIRGYGSEEFDPEGRYLEARFGDLSVVSLYLPSGSSSDERQQAKFRCLDEFYEHLQGCMDSQRRYVICGDWNIAHQEIDLKNWKSNQKNSGFLPEERAWMSKVLDEQGWLDTYRHLHPEAMGECYTWWSNRGRARENNVGWRIDYQLATPNIKHTVEKAWVYKDSFFSDHAPLIVDYAT